MAIIWINNPFDNLEAEGSRPQRYAMLSSELAKRGHRVVWWTSDYSHVHKRPRTDARGTPLPPAFKTGAGAEIRLVPTLPYSGNVSFRRIRSHRLYAEIWHKTAMASVRSGDLEAPDVIISSLPPLSTFRYAPAFRNEFGTRLVTDIQDAWPESFEGLLPGPAFLRSLLWKTLFARERLLAQKAYTEADLITGVGDAYLQLARKAGATCPVRKFRLGIGECLKSLPRETGETVRIVYGGNMGKSYDLATLVSAVRDLISRGTDIRLDLAGAGTEEPRIKRAASGCPAIEFHGFLNRDAYRALLSDAHIGIIPMYAKSLVAVPNKVADYAASGLSVINSLPGETADLISEYDAGLKYEAGNAGSLMAAILELVSNRNKLATQRLNSLKMAEKEFLADGIYPEFCREIEECSGKRMQITSN